MVCIEHIWKVFGENFSSQWVEVFETSSQGVEVFYLHLRGRSFEQYVSGGESQTFWGIRVTSIGLLNLSLSLSVCTRIQWSFIVKNTKTGTLEFELIHLKNNIICFATPEIIVCVILCVLNIKIKILAILLILEYTFETLIILLNVEKILNEHYIIKFNYVMIYLCNITI